MVETYFCGNLSSQYRLIIHVLPTPPSPIDKILILRISGIIGLACLGRFNETLQAETDICKRESTLHFYVFFTKSNISESMIQPAEQVVEKINASKDSVFLPPISAHPVANEEEAQVPPRRLTNIGKIISWNLLGGIIPVILWLAMALIYCITIIGYPIAALCFRNAFVALMACTYFKMHFKNSHLNGILCKQQLHTISVKAYRLSMY